MFLFCFTKILNKAFYVHDWHIWLWGFFTSLVALAYSVPVQIKPYKQTNTTICIVRKGKYVENLYRGKLPQLYDLTFCWHTAYMALVHLTSSFDMPNHCRSNESTFLYCQSNGSTFRTYKRVAQIRIRVQVQNEQNKFFMTRGSFKGFKSLEKDLLSHTSGPTQTSNVELQPWHWVLQCIPSPT